ncbi:putative rna recognition motif containing protein [Zalerion maritima]|uniref:Rna recognition motif containing protein n=1 Tax=Zalerion maritima TaxID=339359 RepID=A0AAD5RXS3_9PEZI|nr:putative rna recognition motif containing protein [Zalerion maritima]
MSGADDWRRVRDRDWRLDRGGGGGGGGASRRRRGRGLDYDVATSSGGAFVGQQQETTTSTQYNNSRASSRPSGQASRRAANFTSWRQPRPVTPATAPEATTSGPSIPPSAAIPQSFPRNFRSGSGPVSGPTTSQTWTKARNRNIHQNFVSPPNLGQSSQGYGNEGGGRNDPEDPETTAAIAEGRRIYVGNLLYSAKPEDIEGLLASCGLSYERIHISIDPFTGRNPSYCFVEFPTKPLADAAMTMLSGQELLGREVKCGPCVPKTRADRGETFRRWGDWKGSSPSAVAASAGPGAASPENNPASRDVEIVEDGGARLASPIQTSTSPGGPYEALKHWEGMADAKRRLYVGGLPRMADQRTCDQQVRELFGEFNVEAVSKAISPHNKENRDGRSKGHPNSYYCFVDFPTAEEASQAAEKINGKRMWGGRLRVAHAKGDSRKWREREQFDGWDGGKAIKITQGYDMDDPQM